MGKSPRVAEITLSAAWHAGAVPARLDTTDGVSLEIIHRGTWSHGLGPDFRDALILFDGRELRAGSIEIHLRTRGWGDHGHHLDPAYDTVVLHLVGQHDGTETRRLDGAIVPVAVIGPVDRFAVPEFAAWDWHYCRRRHLRQPALGHQPGFSTRAPPSSRRCPTCRSFRPARGSPIGGAAWPDPLE